MEKRGQVTLFIIVGVILIALVGTVIYLTSSTEPEDTINPVPISDIKPFIESCIDNVVKEQLPIISSRGGTFERGHIYKGNSHNMLAYTNENAKVINKVLTKQQMELELEQRTLPMLNACIDLDVFTEQGYTITKNDMQLTITIGPDDVFAELNYPITLQRSDSTINEEDFSAKMISPLGKLHSLASHILNEEAHHHNFDKDEFMKTYGHQIKIYKSKPYPHTLYTLKTNSVDKEYTFNFGITGTNTVLAIGEARAIDPEIKTCKIQDDCYVNAESCPGSVIQYSDQCLPSFFQPTQGQGQSCNYNDQTYNHGQTWCDFDENRASGNDKVGSRHVKVSCIDGEILYENCRDYREEFCTEDTIATCRVNRWHDCWRQTSASDCLDVTQRDCTWESNMIPKSERGTDRCYPTVNPGFSFWDQNGDEVCDLANEIYDEKIGDLNALMNYRLPTIWMIGVARFCGAMGDCGNKFNILNERSTKSFSSTARKPPASAFQESSKQKVTKLRQVNPLIALTGNEFNCPECEQESMQQRDREFVQEIQSLSPADVIFGGYEFHFPHNAFCELWNYEKSESTCGKCNEGISECSKYKCKSIGPACRFSIDQNGYPKCTKVQSPEEKLEIELSFNRNDVDKTNKFLGLWGYEIKQPLNPWDRIDVQVDTNIPATCKMSFFPNLELDYNEENPDVELGIFAGQYIGKAVMINYQDVMWDPSLNFKYNTSHRFSLKAPSLYVIDELLNKTTQVTNIMTVMNLGKVKENLNNIGSRIQRYKDYLDTNLLETKFNAVMGKIDGISNSIGIKTLNNKQKLFYILSDLQRDPRRIYMFVTCEDIYGNTNEKEVYVNFGVNVDSKPPIITKVVPEENSVITDGQEMTITLNEPSLCRYSINQPTIYDSMDNMNCDFISPPFTCKTNVESNTQTAIVYVKCKDNPIRATSHNLRFEKTGPAETSFNISNVYELSSPLRTTANSAELIINTAQENLCKYSTDKSVFDHMENSMFCSGTQCKATFTTDKEYKLACTVQLNKPSNTDEYVVRYEK